MKIRGRWIWLKNLSGIQDLTIEIPPSAFYSLSNEITKSLSRLGDAPSTQCAAVRTWFLLMIHPPQRWVPRLLNEICHGNSSKNEYSTYQIKGVSNSQRTISVVSTHPGLVGTIRVSVIEIRNICDASFFIFQWTFQSYLSCI